MAKSSLNKLSTSDIQAELRRRERGVGKLQRQRERLVEKLAALDAQLLEMGASAGATRRRARNSMTLLDALEKMLTGNVMGVTEVADAVQKAGYRTTSPNFRTIVNQTLIKDKRFKRVGRGKYTVKG
ncbi:MAG: hypothetical protein HUU19_15170 [Phycisphaerales bacterium]|nr:hypothetical protein [Planctomycetota bacterium]NUQ54016.1 hypothetical protein [Phycisphaerales bacterium]